MAPATGTPQTVKPSRSPVPQTAETDEFLRRIGPALAVAPHSSWIALRCAHDESILEAVMGGGLRDELQAIARAEHALHVMDRKFPRIEPTRALLARFRCGQTFALGDAEGMAGLLVLLRDEGSPRFEQAEIERLEHTLATMNYEFVAWRDAENVSSADDFVRTRTPPALFVLNDRYEVESSWTPRSAPRILAAPVPGGSPARLEPAVEEFVRRMTAAWRHAVPSEETIVSASLREETVVLRAFPLQGRNGRRIALTAERIRSRNAVQNAASRFGLSARELEVLALVLAGYDTPEIGRLLAIAPSTVIDHVKRMLAKTQSRSRAELAARVLGWRTSAQ